MKLAASDLPMACRAITTNFQWLSSGRWMLSKLSKTRSEFVVRKEIIPGMYPLLETGARVQV